VQGRPVLPSPKIRIGIGSEQRLNYAFSSLARRDRQWRFAVRGYDIGISAGGVLGWAVLAPTGGIPAGALAGEYVGASGDLGIGLGVGANVLIGGSARTFALQPVSLEGSIAVDVALGISSLKLRPAF